MKKQNIFLLLLLLLGACEKESEALMPEVSWNVSASIVSIYETLRFEFTGKNAKQMVVYPGDAGHDYDLKHQSNTGLVMNKGILTYAYKKPGLYKAVLVASNYDLEAGVILSDTTSVNILVEDDRTGLRTVSLKKDLYNKELAGELTDEAILFKIPYKVRVNNKDVAVNIAKQRIELAAYSDAALILLNDEAYKATASYNLSEPLTIKVVSDAGDSKEYSVKTMHYPVFDNFSINNVNGTLQYSEYDFDKAFISLTLPAGTDVRSLTPVFSSADALSICIADSEQQTGLSLVDFTDPVSYILKTESCETEITVTVKYE
ncbi:MAG: hypothetical protein LBS25_01560 [Candidatus Symbiothrix sp.]|jgi:hypothetical protein|nr:hypothetical protein [Candidatus Symbiothrix sp.]